MKKLLVLKPDMKTSEPVDKRCRPWLKHLKRSNIGVDESIARYLNYEYGDQVKVDYKNPYKVNPNKYNKIYNGLEYWGLAHLLKYKGKKAEDKYLRYLKKIPKRKLYLPYQYIVFGHDKCKVYKELKKLKIRLAPTECMKASTLNPQKVYNMLKRKKWKRVFIKPIPGEEFIDIYDSGKELDYESLKEYILRVKKKKYDFLVFQKFMKDFSTERHPEIRTFWIGDKLQVAVKTAWIDGDIEYVGKVHRLNKYIKEKSKKIIKYLEKRFKFKFIMARLDWGYDREMKGYFFNEIEVIPGIFNEELDADYGKCYWNLDEKIGDRLMETL